MTCSGAPKGSLATMMHQPEFGFWLGLRLLPVCPMGSLVLPCVTMESELQWSVSVYLRVLEKTMVFSKDSVTQA
jgi:hypothetical protein